MDLQIDFAAFLPQMYLPTYDKVISLLTQTVPDFPRGGAMLTRVGKGVFSIKVYDKTKAEKLLGKKIEYYYEGDKSTKNLTKVWSLLSMRMKVITIKLKTSKMKDI